MAKELYEKLNLIKVTFFPLLRFKIYLIFFQLQLLFSFPSFLELLQCLLLIPLSVSPSISWYSFYRDVVSRAALRRSHGHCRVVCLFPLAISLLSTSPDHYFLLSLRAELTHICWRYDLLALCIIFSMLCLFWLSHSFEGNIFSFSCSQPFLWIFLSLFFSPLCLVCLFLFWTFSSVLDFLL